MVPLLPLALLVAATAGEERVLPEVLVWELKTVGAPDELGQMVQLALAQEVAKVPAIRVLSVKDLSAALDVQYQQRLHGCTDEACIGEVSGALGIRYVLFSELVAVEGELLISLRLMDMSHLQVVSTSSTRCAPSASAAIDATGTLVERVFFPERGGRPWAKAGFISSGVFGVATVVLAVLWRSAVVDYGNSVLPDERLGRRAQTFGGLTIVGGGLTLLSLAVGTYLQLRYEGAPLELEREKHGARP